MAGWSLSIFCSLIFIRSTLLTDIEMWQWDFASQGFSQCHKTFVLRVTWLAKSLSYLELQCYRVARRRGLRTENSATHIVLSTCQKYVVDFFVMEVVIASTIEHPPKGLSEIFSLSFFSCSVFLLLLTRHPWKTAARISCETASTERRVENNKINLKIDLLSVR